MMQETDYINATNLAKLRIAEHILHVVYPIGDDAMVHHDTAKSEIRWLIDHYEGQV
jgi:hypothetical protein